MILTMCMLTPKNLKVNRKMYPNQKQQGCDNLERFCVNAQWQ